MNLEDVEINDLKLLNGQCLIEIHSWTEDEIPFNGTTLKLVNKIKGSIEEPSYAEFQQLLNSMKKSRYKDMRAMSEYMRMQGEQNKQADQEKEDIEAKQAVRRGVIIKTPLTKEEYGRWDFDCEFDGRVGDEVYFDAMYTKNKIDESEGGFEKDGKRYVIVPSKAIFAAKRNEELISMNGYILGTELSNERVSGGIFLPDAKTSKVRVDVAPTRYPKYLHERAWSNTEVKKGDVVYIKDDYAVKLDNTIAQTTNMIRFQPRVILAIEE